MHYSFAVDNVSVSRDTFRITGISFSLKSGDIMGLVGRSGSGKSTIISALLGLKKTDSGTIRASFSHGKGENIVGLRNIIGYSPQENSLFPFLTIMENMGIFAKLYAIGRKEFLANSEKLLAQLHLTDHRNKKIIHLSGGMQKRADIAVSLIHDPKIIILDEPFNGLDISLQRFIWNYLISLSKEGKIIIVSSHLLSDIERNCNQLGLVHEGYFYNTQHVAAWLKGNPHKRLEELIGGLFDRREK